MLFIKCYLLNVIYKYFIYFILYIFNIKIIIILYILIIFFDIITFLILYGTKYIIINKRINLLTNGLFRFW